MSRLEIRPSGPSDHQVLLDGAPVYPAAVELRFEGGTLPTAVLQLVVLEAPTIADPARIMLPPETTDLLRRLGWTPPEALDAS